MALLSELPALIKTLVLKFYNMNGFTVISHSRLQVKVYFFIGIA